MADRLVKALLVVVFLSGTAGSGGLTHWAALLRFASFWYEIPSDEKVNLSTLEPLDVSGYRKYFYSYQSAEKTYLISPYVHRLLQGDTPQNKLVRVYCHSNICSDQPRRVNLNVSVWLLLLGLLIFALTRQIFEPD